MMELLKLSIIHLSPDPNKATLTPTVANLGAELQYHELELEITRSTLEKDLWCHSRVLGVGEPKMFWDMFKNLCRVTKLVLNSADLCQVTRSQLVETRTKLG